MNAPLIQLISIRFKEFTREPGVVFWSIIFPIAMAWVLGVAFSKKGELVQTIAIVSNISRPNEKLRDFLSGSEQIISQVIQQGTSRILLTKNLANQSTVSSQHHGILPS